MTRQAEMIDKFTEKWAKTYKDTRGRLSIQQEAERSTEKNALMQYQQKVQQDEQELVKAAQIIDKDEWQGHYDHDYFNQAYMQYLETGMKPDGGFLEPSAADLKELYNAKPGELVLTDSGQHYASSTKKEYATYWAMRDERTVKAVRNVFSKLPIEKQQEYLDKYGDNKDAVINAFLDVEGVKTGSAHEKTNYKTKSKSSFSITIGLGGAKPEGALPTQDIVVGGEAFNVMTPFSSVSESKRVRNGSMLKNAKILETDKTGERFVDYTPNPLDKFIVDGYSESRDAIILRMPGDNQNEYDVVYVPRIGNEGLVEGLVQFVGNLVSGGTATTPDYNAIMNAAKKNKNK
jgi:hypothetical protein